MGSPSAPSDVDPHELERANRFWSGFLAFGKYTLIAVIVILSLLAVFLLER